MINMGLIVSGNVVKRFGMKKVQFFAQFYFWQTVVIYKKGIINAVRTKLCNR